jgi:hypothetical protein
MNTNVHAQEVSAQARLDTTDILIGDQINLNITFSMPMDYRVLWPFSKDTLTRNIEIIRQSPVDTIRHEKENFVDLIQTITITSFDSGYYKIPALSFAYQPINDTSFYEIQSIPSYLEVHTMEVDTTQAIKAIKPPLAAPLTFREVLPWLLIGLSALILILLIIYIIRKRKKKEPLFKIRPKIILPPHIVAINELESLKQKKLWQSGKVKDYYTELTDIVRKYIEDSLGVQAVEMTTEEIMESLKGSNIKREVLNKLGGTLTLADLVKFAKEKPLPLENDNCFSHSMEFVKETTPQLETKEDDTEAELIKEEEEK